MIELIWPATLAELEQLRQNYTEIQNQISELVQQINTIRSFVKKGILRYWHERQPRDPYYGANNYPELVSLRSHLGLRDFSNWRVAYVGFFDNVKEDNVIRFGLEGPDNIGYKEIEIPFSDLFADLNEIVERRHKSLMAEASPLLQEIEAAAVAKEKALLKALKEKYRDTDD